MIPDSRRPLLMALPALALALLLTWLFSASQTDGDQHAAIVVQMLQLEQQDARINQSVVYARVGLIHHYDEIVESLTETHKSMSALRRLTRQAFVGTDNDLDMQIEGIDSLLTRKEALIEKFKTSNAVLRFTTQTFPEAARDFLFALGSDEQISPDLRRTLTDRTRRLLVEALGFMQSDNRPVARLLRLKDQLRADRKKLSKPLVGKLSLLTRYASVLVKVKAKTDARVHTILALPSRQALATLHAYYNRLYEARLEEAGTYRTGMYICSVLLLLYLAYVMFRLQRTSTELRGAMKNLEFQKSALDQHAIVSATNLSGEIIYANDKFCEISQFSNEELMGANHRIIKSDQHNRQFYRDLWRTIANGNVWHGEICNRKKNGDLYWVASTIVPFMGENGKPEQYIAIRTDITDHKTAEQEISVLARFPAENPGAVLRISQEGEVLYANACAEPLLAMWGSSVGQIMPEDWLKKIADCFESQESTQTEIVCEDCHILMTMVPIIEQGYINLYGMDVTERKRAEDQLAFQARHDALTGLVNRREMEADLAEAVEQSLATGAYHALLFMDLDQFKIVNDTCGHMAGDELLRQLCGVLRMPIRDTDVLARLGGDEFAVLLRNCPIEQARGVAGKLLKCVNDFRFSWDGQEFSIGVSIGLVPITSESVSVASVMSAADMACYVAKDTGRNRVHVYDGQDTETAELHGEMHWVSRITKALEEDRFVLYGQKIMPLAASDRGRVHMEVLLRMLDENGEIIPPNNFIPAAERYHLMPAIDRWVVRNVIELYKRYRAEKPEQKIKTLAVNLSGASLGDADLLDWVAGLMRDNANIARSICFEVTETAAIGNLALAVHFMHELKALGCRFSLDDFGSGLSSFGYLKNLPVDYLKIDGEFVKDIVDDPMDHAMVSAIHQVGHVMGIETIAEFVENDAIIDILRRIGVDYGQGYGIARPEPMHQLLNLASAEENVLAFKPKQS